MKYSDTYDKVKGDMEYYERTHYEKETHKIEYFEH